MVSLCVWLRNGLVLLAFLTVSFFAHRLFQRLHYEYCISNIFIAYLFKTSNFCVILEDAIGFFELVFRKFLI